MLNKSVSVIIEGSRDINRKCSVAVIMKINLKSETDRLFRSGYNLNFNLFFSHS